MSLLVKLDREHLELNFIFERRASDGDVDRLVKFLHSLHQGRHIWLIQPHDPICIPPHVEFEQQNLVYASKKSNRLIPSSYRLSPPLDTRHAGYMHPSLLLLLHKNHMFPSMPFMTSMMFGVGSHCLPRGLIFDRESPNFILASDSK